MNFTTDINNKGAKSKSITFDFKALSEEVELSYDENIGDGKPPNLHERIIGKCIPYIDYDSFDGVEMRIPSAEKIEKAIKSVFGDSVEILLADRSGLSVKHNKYKLSLRAYIRNAGYFSCPQAAKDFMMNSFSPLLGDCIDDVYKSNQNMGLLFNCKMGDPRILEPLNNKFERIHWSEKNADYLLKSLIQNVEGETVCLDPPDFDIRATSIESVVGVVGDIGIDGIVSACVKLMPNLSVRKVLNKGEFQVIEFRKCEDECAICKRIHKSNRPYATYYPDLNMAFLKCHDADAKDNKIKLILPDVIPSVEEMKTMIPLNISDESGTDEAEDGGAESIPFGIPYDDFDISRDAAVMDVARHQFDFCDPYNYNDFRNQFNNKVFSSFEDMELALSIYPRVIAYSSLNKGCFMKKSKNGHLDVVDKLRTSDFNITYGTKNTSFEKYLCTKKSFQNITCKLENCPDDEFNIWNGFQAKLVSPASESDGCKRMKQFVMEVWAGNNLEVYNHIINWFAGLVKNLSGINQMALVMVSPQGTGKNTLTDFMKLILRDINCATADGIGDVVDKFNVMLQNKRLINVNEMCSAKDDFKSNFDKIKGKITDETINIESKGMNKVKVPNIGNYILFTNHRDALIIEEFDRRYSIHEMSSCRMNDKEYFTNLRRDCFTQSVADEFYTYLMSVELVPCVPMMTDIRREMMELSKPSPLKFLDAINDENMFEGLNEVKAKELYTEYKNWCNDNGERHILTSTKFGLIITTKIEKKRKSSGCVYIIRK